MEPDSSRVDHRNVGRTVKPDTIELQRATTADLDSIVALVAEIVDEGDVFLAVDRPAAAAVNETWLMPPSVACVARTPQALAGAYVLKPNHPGRGSHVANGTYMVAREWRGRGLGRRLGEHSLQTARACGYSALQFNAVVSSNVGAVRLWQSLGFRIIGTVPAGFQHPALGLVDLYIMHRAL